MSRGGKREGAGRKKGSLDARPRHVAREFTDDAVNRLGEICKNGKARVRASPLISAAKDISEQKEANLTFRVRFKTKQYNAGTMTYRYHVLLFPASSGGSGEQAATAKQ
jgi:hypothetical protein